MTRHLGIVVGNPMLLRSPADIEHSHASHMGG
jgi:hypothetical protein